MLNPSLVDAIFLTNTANASIFNMTSNAIASLRESAPEAHVIVVETNAAHGYGVYPATVIEPRKPFNYNEFMNIGIRYGKGEFVLMCNNDITFLAGAVPNLIQGMNDHQLDSASPWEPSWHPRRFPDDGRAIYFGYAIEREICGWCIIARRSMLERLQPLDEQFEFWAQDLDYAKTLEVNGVRHGLVRAALVKHAFSVSHDLLGEKRQHMTHEQVKKFQKKWTPKVKPRVFDCFTFFNEVQMLQMRLAELKDVVDTFVLAEAAQTFTGKAKGLVFHENRWAFPSNVHAVAADQLNGSDAWQREASQRQLLLKGLQEAGAKSDDIILLSDVDEIPDVSVVPRLMDIEHPVSLVQHLFYYNFTCRCCDLWTKAKALRYRDFVLAASVDAIRMTPYALLDQGGWHLSYFLDPKKIMEKVSAFSHQEFNTPEYMNAERIQRAIQGGSDLFGRPVKFEHVSVESNPYLPKNFKMLM